MCSSDLAPPGGSAHGGHLFIELEELKGSEWLETGRWNHALEEEGVIKEGGDANTWSRPHLPLISVPALAKLRDSISTQNIFLDVPGRTYPAVSRYMCSKLAANGMLPQEHLETILASLGSERKGRDGKPRGRLTLGSAKSSGNVSRTTTQISAPPKGDIESPPPRIAGMKASTAADELFHMLDPEKGEEVSSLNVAHFPFLKSVAVAFGRLTAPIDAGCEEGAPVRFLALILTPEVMSRDAVKMAHALAGMMLDEHFVTKLYGAKGPVEILDALDRNLEAVHILPHVHKLPAADPMTVETASELSFDEVIGEDEDDVLLAEMEERLRARKGLPARQPPAIGRTNTPTSNDGLCAGSTPNSAGGLMRKRASFDKELHNLGEGAKLTLETSSTRPKDIASRLFIVAEQQTAGVWKETHHWNWALEQKVKEDGTWTRPFLPTISVPEIGRAHV